MPTTCEWRHVYLLTIQVFPIWVSSSSFCVTAWEVPAWQQMCSLNHVKFKDNTLSHVNAYVCDSSPRECVFVCKGFSLWYLRIPSRLKLSGRVTSMCTDPLHSLHTVHLSDILRPPGGVPCLITSFPSCTQRTPPGVRQQTTSQQVAALHAIPC